MIILHQHTYIIRLLYDRLLLNSSFIIYERGIIRETYKVVQI